MKWGENFKGRNSGYFICSSSGLMGIEEVKILSLRGGSVNKGSVSAAASKEQVERMKKKVQKGTLRQ